MDTAGQIANLSKAILFQKKRDLLAAHAVVTDADNLLRSVQFGQLTGDAIHRDIKRTVNKTSAKFPRLTYVE